MLETMADFRNMLKYCEKYGVEEFEMGDVKILFKDQKDRVEYKGFDKKDLKIDWAAEDKKMQTSFDFDDNMKSMDEVVGKAPESEEFNDELLAITDPVAWEKQELGGQDA